MNGPIDAELLGRLLDEHGAALALYASQWTESADDCVQEALVELASSGQKALAKEGLDVLCHELDVTVRSSVAALASYLNKEHGRVDVLVNNAGILIDSSSTSILDEKEDVFHATLETNFFGALRVEITLMVRFCLGRRPEAHISAAPGWNMGVVKPCG